ncbi:MAG: hypothetical protein GX951_00540 [Mollicutes bacterium]|nr:hypothetical protein [Mollicutes bacterium]
MSKTNQAQVVLTSIFGVIIIVMSVGFATLTSQLNINGNVAVKSSNYNVYLDDTSYQIAAGSQPIEPPTILGTTITYNATLNQPGEFIEFSINVLNQGTMDTYLKAITLGGITDSYKDYISYVITYNSVEYTETTTDLNVLLSKDTGLETITIKVVYSSSLDEVMPTEDEIELNLICVLDYATQ